MSGITTHAKPSDKFELHEDGGPGAFSFPCSACKSKHRLATDLPCVLCGHNDCRVTPIEGFLPEILAGAMTFDQMIQLICDVARVISIEVPSKPHGAESFAVRMVGAVTVGKRRSDYVEWKQKNHIDLMRV